MSQPGPSTSPSRPSISDALPAHKSLASEPDARGEHPGKQAPPSRSDTRSAITFRGLIEGSDDHQWIIADAIRDVDTCGRGGAPCHRWLVHTVTDGFSPLQYTARVIGQQWAVEARSPERLAEAIRIQFPRSLRSHASRATVRTDDTDVGPISQRRVDTLTRQDDLDRHMPHDPSSDAAAGSPSRPAEA